MKFFGVAPSSPPPQGSEEGVRIDKAKQQGVTMNNKAMKQQWRGAKRYLKKTSSKVQWRGNKATRPSN
jgi:hypothetical protein